MSFIESSTGQKCELDPLQFYTFVIIVELCDMINGHHQLRNAIIMESMESNKKM